MIPKLKELLSKSIVSLFLGSSEVNNSKIVQWLRILLGPKSSVSLNLHVDNIKKIYQQIISTDYYSPSTHLEVENIFLIQSGVLVFYHVFEPKEIRVFALLFETAQPKRALWYHPRLVTQFSNLTEKWQFVSLEKFELRLESYWWSPLLGTQQKIYPNYRFQKQIEVRHSLPILFKPRQFNPMIQPHSMNSWEAFNTFNPAAFYAADKIHILYRAQGFDYVSQIGYATSLDGLTIEKRFDQPIYRPTQIFEGVSLPLGDPAGRYASGGGSGGVEDPRVTIIDEKMYMTYVAYDGWNPPRVALTSILLTDFLNQNYLWEKPVLISPPGVVDKSAVIFPEKVKGKYVIMHRIFPNIYIDYVDSLEFTGDRFLENHAQIEPRSREWWDSRKIGAGAPPLKTTAGWLLIYQATDDKDASRYMVGAMLLDLDDPQKVIARSAEPILFPNEQYENSGFKAGVVYPCGAVIKNGTLFVYYGGADSYVCVATAQLDSFLADLQKTGITSLHQTQLSVETTAEGLYD